jgi:hypothetical protein
MPFDNSVIFQRTVTLLTRCFYNAWTKLRRDASHQDNEKWLSIYFRTYFSMCSPHVRPTSIFRLYLWRHIKPQPIQLQLQMNRHITDPFFMSVKPSTPSPRPLERHESPWLDVFFRALFQMEDILGICLNYNLINNKHSTVIKMGTCIVMHHFSCKYKIILVKVIIVECNLSIRLKNHSFWTRVCMTFLPCFDVRHSLLKSVQAF